MDEWLAWRRAQDARMKAEALAYMSERCANTGNVGLLATLTAHVEEMFAEHALPADDAEALAHMQAMAMRSPVPDGEVMH